MMFTVYALRSKRKKYIYVGLTGNLEKRIRRHNKGYEKTTKPYAPFDLIYSEIFDTRLQAREIEKYLKSAVGKEFLKNIK